METVSKEKQTKTQLVHISPYEVIHKQPLILVNAIYHLNHSAIVSTHRKRNSNTINTHTNLIIYLGNLNWKTNILLASIKLFIIQQWESYGLCISSLYSSMIYGQPPASFTTKEPIFHYGEIGYRRVDRMGG